MNICDVFSYRRIVISNIHTSNYHIINHNLLNRYRNYTSFIFSNRTGVHVYDYLNLNPQTHVVGYNVPTISGYYWMPVFNHQLGRLRETLNLEIKESHKKKIFQTLLIIGIPYVVAKIIMNYI